jgi:hypothetical protein
MDGRHRIASLVCLLPTTVLFIAAETALADTYTVSGLTFEKPHLTGSGTREDREVSRVDRERPDPPENTGPSAREIAREQAAEARARAKQLKAIELQRVQSNEEKIGFLLRQAASRPLAPPPPIVLHVGPEPEITARRESLQTAIESPEHRVPALREQAREEWYWFQVNQMDLMWGAIGAGLDPTGPQPPLDDTAREAREHLANYIELVKELESITHTREYAEQRYQERVRWLKFERSSAYNVNNSDSTAKTDIYPPSDTFAPWSEDEIIRHGRRCTFDYSGHLSCGN